MAEFGTQATQVSGPQGAGSQPIAPVQEQFVASPWADALKTLGTTLGGISDTYIKQQQLELKNGVLKDIADNEAKLNNGLSQGTISPAEADARSRAKFNQALAAYPALASDISGLRSAFKATAETGSRDVEIEAAQKTKELDDRFAREHNYRITPNMSPAEREVQIQAAYAGAQAEAALKAQYAKDEHDRQQGTYNQAQADRQRADLSFNLVQDIATKNLTALNGHISSLLADVQAGRITSEQASLDLNNKNASLQGTIQLAAQRNPELATAWKGLFDEQYRIGVEMLKPGANLQSLQNQRDEIIARQQLLMLGNPQVVKAAAISKFFPSTPLTQLGNANAAMQAAMEASTTPVTNGTGGGYVTPIAGNPNIESSVLASLKVGIQNLKSDKLKAEDIGKANVEGSNTINNVLVQTGNLIKTGTVDPKNLKGLADFFASPEYGWMVSHGKIDAQAAQAAKYTFQSSYEPTVVSAIGDKLKAPVAGAGSLPLAGNIDIKYTGAGVSFVPASNSQNPNETKTAIASLQQAQTALNTLVHLGAHLEGTTDYQKYWEDNKHLFLPQVYPDPAKLKVGQVVKGRKYIGGNYNNPASWTTDGVNGGQ